jgi:aspartate/methionine/tyrosine aminotransferase
MEYDRPLFYRVMAYAADADRDVVDMVSGSPDWEPPEAIREGLASYAHGDAGAFRYPPSEGLSDLREEVAARRNVDPERVIVTNGAGEANYLAMARALDRGQGSEVILVDPVYPYYAGRTEMLDGQARYVPAGDDGSLDPGTVREAASEATACIVVNTPNNPTGTVYDAATMRELVGIAEATDALLVADETYDHFVLDGAFESALAIDSPNRIVTNSFSKSLAITGFRVGYAVFPEEHVDAARTRHMLVNVAGSRPAQHAVLHALENTGPAYYAGNRDLLRDRLATFTDALEAIGAAYVEPEAGFYVMARFEGVPGTMANAKRLIEEAGVAAMPGETFGETRTEWFRFALCTPRIGDAGDRLRAYFR